MSDTLVKVENVSKKFCRDLKRSLWYGVKDIGSELFGGSNGSSHELRRDEFWAVKDVSFELKRGECLGLIGHNGAGKSTLLKMLNGLIKPDGGRICMQGRVGALIELGAGFNPILSGRENVYINGQVLGFEKREIDKKFDEIVEFAEVGEFIDMPVQNYSSGMKVRLGFAVAAQMDPDILIIDEVLAVGDIGFRIKCLNKIGELITRSAVFLVSHTMPQIARVCSRAVMMDHGSVVVDTNDISLAVTEYLSRFGSEAENRIGGENVSVVSFNVVYEDVKMDGEPTFQCGAAIKLRVGLKFSGKTQSIVCKVFFVNQDMRTVLDVPSQIQHEPFMVDRSGWLALDITIPKLSLNPGRYGISLVIQDSETQDRLYRHDNIAFVRVLGSYISWCDCIAESHWKIIPSKL